MCYTDLMHNTTITRPWGVLQTLEMHENYIVKKIMVPPGKQCSLHVHQSHDEHWIVVSGEGQAVVGDQTTAIKPNMYVYLPAKLPHRVMNTGSVPLHYIEVVYGEGPADQDLKKLDPTYDI